MSSKQNAKSTHVRMLFISTLRVACPPLTIGTVVQIKPSNPVVPALASLNQDIADGSDLK